MRADPMRIAMLLLYYGVLRHLPGSYLVGGAIWRYLRLGTCRQLFRKCGENVNIERGAYFGSGEQLSVGNMAMKGPRTDLSLTLLRVRRAAILAITLLAGVVGCSSWSRKTKGAVIGAGSVVPRDVPDYAVVAGNPARIVRMRNCSIDCTSVAETSATDKGAFTNEDCAGI